MNIKISVITARTHNEYVYHATVEGARTVAEAYWQWQLDDNAVEDFEITTYVCEED